MSREQEILKRIATILKEKWIPEQVIFEVEREVDSYFIHDAVMACNSCELHDKCGNKVPGSGPMPAEIMFIGEAPGAVEDQCGIPFSGPAGQLLNKIIESIGWKREEIYITNVLKCRTDESNRNPTKAEIATCYQHLKKEIELVNPRVIVCWGSIAANTLIHPDFKITHEHGAWFEKEDGKRLIAMFHPAYLLRLNGKQELDAKTKVWEAIQKVNRYKVSGWKDELTPSR